MKLLGKSLYSNPWAAISELVANGFDAGAQNITVLIDLSQGKNAATFEILDDGLGMDSQGIRDYVQVGRNRRLSPTENTSLPMGRKGIGKLAALYLSDEFYLLTKKNDRESTWHLQIPENAREDSKPALEEEPSPPANSHLYQKWKSSASGTLLTIKNVDLHGLGDKALESLSYRLAGQFLLSSMGTKTINLAVLTTKNAQVVFKPVEKRVAFKNFMMVFSSYENSLQTPSEISDLRSHTVKLPVDGRDVDFSTQVGGLSDLLPTTNGTNNLGLAGTIDFPLADGSTLSLPYKLTGWLAVHSTISETTARANDKRFTKNKFYNPSQIRLYVRNKLASENVLQSLGITGAFANYIEGEVSFDILDDDALSDIATTNRQGFDENDVRVDRLHQILRQAVRTLITKRTNIMQELKSRAQAARDEVQARAKSQFISEVHQDLIDARIEKRTADELIIPLSNKLQGATITAKTDHKLFLSHSSRDKDILDFIYYLLLEKGVDRDEIFYTSATHVGDETPQYESLTSLMKKFISDSKTRIVYVTSPGFTGSLYCLFEAGAGWITRGVSEFDLISLTFDHRLEMLHHNVAQETIYDLKESKFKLDTNVYLSLTHALNNMIRHVNAGRSILNMRDPIELFRSNIPALHDREDPLRPDSDFMDEDFINLWRTYASTVTPNRYEDRK